jgi:hypothetical protein
LGKLHKQYVVLLLTDLVVNQVHDVCLQAGDSMDYADSYLVFQGGLHG